MFNHKCSYIFTKRYATKQINVGISVENGTYGSYLTMGWIFVSIIIFQI